jgi:hypothetical protein
MKVRLLISVVVLTSTVANGAWAQESESEDDAPAHTPEDAEAQAQRYFMEARDAFDQQRYADARRLLEESLSLAPRPATAINLARVLRSLGEQLEMIATLDSLIEGRYGDVGEDRMVEARELRAEARASLARIVVSASGEDSVSIRVDGVEVNELADGDAYEQELDPGEHAIVGVTDDGRLKEVSVELAPGEQREVALTFEPWTAPEREENEEDEAASGTSPWVWVAIAGGALAVGAIVLAVVLATTSNGALPREDPDGVFPIIEALSW